MTVNKTDQEKIIIRHMEPEDIDVILEIDRKVTGILRVTTYAEQPPNYISGDINLSFVAQINNKIVGFVLIQHAYIGEPLIEAGLIKILGVDPDYWKQGIATKLVMSALEFCRSHGLEMHIMINENDDQLQRLFQRLGFSKGKLIDFVYSL